MQWQDKTHLWGFLDGGFEHINLTHTGLTSSVWSIYYKIGVAMAFQDFVGTSDSSEEGGASYRKQYYDLVSDVEVAVDSGAIKITFHSCWSRK